MSTVKIPLPKAIDLIASGLDKALEDRIAKALRPVAEKIVLEAAKTLCQDMSSNIWSWEETKTGEVHISLTIDKKPIDWVENPKPPPSRK